MDTRQQRELIKLAPYFQAASDSDKDHGPEVEDIAELDLNTGSAIAATSVDHTPSHAIPIPQSYEETMRSTHA